MPVSVIRVIFRLHTEKHGQAIKDTLELDADADGRHNAQLRWNGNPIF